MNIHSIVFVAYIISALISALLFMLDYAVFACLFFFILNVLFVIIIDKEIANPLPVDGFQVWKIGPELMKDFSLKANLTFFAFAGSVLSLIISVMRVCVSARICIFRKVFIHPFRFVHLHQRNYIGYQKI